MPIVPNPEALKQLESLGVTRPVPQIQMPPPPTVNRAAAAAAAGVVRQAPAQAVYHAVAPAALAPVVPVPSSNFFAELPKMIEAAIGCFFLGAVVATIASAAFYGLRIAGVLSVLACLALPTVASQQTGDIIDNPVMQSTVPPAVVANQDSMTDTNTDSAAAEPAVAESEFGEATGSHRSSNSEFGDKPFEPVPQRERQAPAMATTDENWWWKLSLLCHLATMFLMEIVWIELRLVTRQFDLPIPRNLPPTPMPPVDRPGGGVRIIQPPVEPSSVSQLPVPSPRNPRWVSAVHSIQGPVRTSNQDYALLDRLPGIEILAVADGCGGTPHGEVASRCAVTAAMACMRGSLSESSSASPTLIERAFGNAAQSLHQQAEKLGFENFQGAPNRFGLRTTLMLVIATQDNYFFGYIGDGAMILQRKSGEVLELMTPQRVGNHANVLAACLGPTTIGEPVVAQATRQSDDLLLVATDGIADAYDSTTLVEGLRRFVEANSGDVTFSVERFLEDAAHTKDEYGCPRFDDNLTLGLMVNRTTIHSSEDTRQPSSVAAQPPRNNGSRLRTRPIV